MVAARSLFRGTRQGRAEVFAFATTQRPDFWVALKQAISAADGLILIGAGDDQLGIGNIDAMRQRLVGEVVIDQAGNNANFRQTIPDRDIFGPVLHEQGHGVAALQTKAQSPIRHLIGERVHLGIGGEIAFKSPGDIIRVFVGHAFKIISDQIIGVRIDIIGPFFHSHQRQDRPDFAINGLPQPHSELASVFPTRCILRNT